MPLTVVLDPGHGGAGEVDGSSANNAVSSSGVLEKQMALALALGIRRSVEKRAGAAYAANHEKSIRLLLTRETDVNLGLAERAKLARDHHASLFLSLHFNTFDGKLRGTEAWIDRKYDREFCRSLLGQEKRASEGPGDPTSSVRNINHVDDAVFGATLVQAVVNALKPFDPEARALSTVYSAEHHGEGFRPPAGVRMRGLELLRDKALSATPGDCRACLLMVEFIDNPAVDLLLNGPKGALAQTRLADAIGCVLVDFA